MTFNESKHFSSILEALKKITRKRKLSVSIHSRAQLMLLIMKTKNISFISRVHDCSREKVRRWRDRALTLIIEWSEEDICDEKMLEDILIMLADRYRSGAPPTFSAEETCIIVALALEEPSESGLPISIWSATDLADEAERREIVKSISPSTISRMLREISVRPHKSKYWLNPNIECQVEFEKQVKEICETYARAEELSKNNTIVISIDEKTGMQATERCAPDKPMQPGSPVKIEFEYLRHGCRCLTPSFNILTGKIIAYQLGETRTSKEFVLHIKDTVATSPDSNWVFVMDQLNTHKSAELVEYFAQGNGYTRKLGKIRRYGILENQKKRAEFLSRSDQKLRIQYTPKHCSWMNQIEIWFGIFHRKALRRASFSSIDKLIERVESFIKYYNENMAHPFKWTYMGKALVA